MSSEVSSGSGEAGMGRVEDTGFAAGTESSEAGFR
jgi:hypothetical protein